jgi:AraC family ethanolamine operon transcriptional activator
MPAALGSQFDNAGQRPPRFGRDGARQYRYLRLRRLWAVRRLLLAGNKPLLQIKACALSNGFWHMGEFAALYAAQFGEAPSMTLARARQQLR